MDGDGDEAGHGDVHQRDRLRLAAGRRSRSPVSINANTTYVVSYFAPDGHTAQDEYVLLPAPRRRGPTRNSDVDSPPLHALRNTNGTVNGAVPDQHHEHVPDEQPRTRQLLGRRDVQPEHRAGDRAGSADGRDRHPRQRLGES